MAKYNIGNLSIERQADKRIGGKRVMISKVTNKITKKTSYTAAVVFPKNAITKKEALERITALIYGVKNGRF